MRKHYFFIILVSLFLALEPVVAQQAIDRSVSFEKLYDDPKDINKLYVHLQPVYGELFMTNVTIGFGVEGEYYLNDMFNFNLSFRRAYGQKFDFIRDVAEKNSDLSNSFKSFYFGEVSATYHIRDEELNTPSKFVLYSRRFRDRNQWETMIPQYIRAECKLRRIIGVRAGGASYQSAIDVNSIIKNQGNVPLDTLRGLSVYSNILNHGFFIGGELQLIRNVAIAFESSYDQVTNDLIFTTYADILFFPFTSINDMFYRIDPGSPEEFFSNQLIDTNLIGARAGIKGKFNRELSFGYNIELGLRPGVKGDNFYAMGRLSFPLIGSKLEKKVEGFEN